MDCPAKTIKIRKKRYFLWLTVSGIMTGLACFCLRTSSGATKAVPLNGRLPSEEQLMQIMTENTETPEILPSNAREMPDIDQELLDLLRSASMAIDTTISRDPTIQTMNNRQWKTVRMLVTGYCACPKCCGKFSDGRTANMHRIGKNDVFVAADKKVPFGTRVIIPGYNRDRAVEVKDRGRLIRGNHLDLYFSHHKTARKWGVKYLDVLVLAEE
jgi:3D (Asp-Asp-Asp) domain-containing protein